MSSVRAALSSCHFTDIGSDFVSSSLPKPSSGANSSSQRPSSPLPSHHHPPPHQLPNRNQSYHLPNSPPLLPSLFQVKLSPHRQQHPVRLSQRRRTSLRHRQRQHQLPLSSWIRHRRRRYQRRMRLKSRSSPFKWQQYETRWLRRLHHRRRSKIPS